MYETQIRKYLFERAKRVLKQPYKRIKFPFIDPGEGYEGNLWDWDSYWTAYALLYALRSCGKESEEKFGVSAEVIAEHAKGCVKNFLAMQEKDGFVPTMVTGDGDFARFFTEEHAKGTPLNQSKPFLCQSALNVSEYTGDFSWFDVNGLISYLQYYEIHQKNESTGLFVWENDIMIGIDNNPTVFFRPPRSSADIYLNSFLYMEYQALTNILERLSDERSVTIREKAADLKKAINTYMWDERDGIYYSQDVQFYKTDLHAGSFYFHANLLPDWKTLSIRIRFWGCFLPLYAGICDEYQAESLCNHLKDKAVTSQYGIRTLASDESMYNLEKSSNPSNWLGAIWTVSNYCVWKGLCRYNKNQLAEDLRKSTINLLGHNLLKYGDLFESYNPESGEPNLNPGFLSWNLLLLEMTENI